ncbi:MAG: hypothetical protein M1321_02030 [Candidatus Marsarchaeota archaeon]|jgi:predicted transcriptional regulator of viral defense system|nr:hypothetical protein [Candidatus Marsarchaeota archaeon]
MNSVDFTEMLRELRLPVFTIDTASSIIQKPKPYTRLFINRLRRKNLISMVERGRYCLRGTDDYTLASRIIPDSYLTGYAALEHYGFTTQIPTKLSVVAAKYHRSLRLAGHTVVFSKVKKEFIYGFTITSSGPAFAEPEKIFIDDLYLHGRQLFGEEFALAVSMGRLDLKKLERYAQMSGNKALLKKMRGLIQAAGTNMLR